MVLFKRTLWILSICFALIFVLKFLGTYYKQYGLKIPSLEIGIEGWGVIIAFLGALALGIEAVNNQKFLEILANENEKADEPQVGWHLYLAGWTIALSVMFVVAIVLTILSTAGQAFHVLSGHYDLLSLLELAIKLVALVAIPTLKFSLILIMWHSPVITREWIKKYIGNIDLAKAQIRSIGWRLLILGTFLQLLGNITVT